MSRMMETQSLSRRSGGGRKECEDRQGERVVILAGEGERRGDTGESKLPRERYLKRRMYSRENTRKPRTEPNNP